ncbi:hypothetical protein [Borborobacter arsenicus]|uniref:hypothetical protein n=1 Tax=Borborobacter arsenicus TaxID=1851146 RepID=UPI000FFB931A|nr:hypothetical protein [Pseudaminobacter arsenicus]
MASPPQVDDVVYQMRCSKCDQRGTLKIDTMIPTAAEKQGIILRRIDRIYYVRRVTWKDV